MPGDVSRTYKGPKDGRIPTWMLRGGPGHDYPSDDPTVTECALSRCQHAGACRRIPQESDRD